MFYPTPTTRGPASVETGLGKPCMLASQHFSMIYMGKTHLHTCDPKRLLFCYVKSTHRRTQIDFNIFSNRLELFTFLGMKGAPLMHLYNTYLSFSTNFYIYDVHKSTLSHLYVQYYIKGLGIRSFALLLKIAHIKERL